MIELFLILLFLSSVFSIQLSKNTINSYNLTYTSSIRVGEPQKEIKLDEYLCSYGLEKLLITLGQDYSHIIRHEKIGEGSVDKRAIWAVQISRNVQFKRKLLKPMIKLVANINGDETVGYGLMVSLIQYLVYSDGVDERITQMLNTTDIWIVPTLNPDRLFALENRASQILYPTKYSSNGRGVELDQDFPDAFVEETWPYQEETESMLKFIKQNPFVLSANLQGGAIVASYPFDNNPDRSTLPGVLSLTPDNEMFEKLAKDYAQRNRMMAHGKECGKSFPDGISNGNYWNKKLGSMQDANYLLSNCFEITLHLSCCKWVPPFDLPKYWAANLPSMLNFIESVHQGIFGLVKDKEDNPIKGAFVKVKGRNKYIRTTEDGEYWMLLVPGSYHVTVRAPPTFIEETKLVVLTENKTHVQLDFHLTRQSVYGTVVNKENRNLVKGAIIKAFQREENKYVGNGIDIKVHDGKFGFKLSAGIYEMTVVAPGYCNSTKAVIVAEQEPVKVDFSLIHQGVYGTVRDANGNPVEGAVIKVLLQSERLNDNSQYPIDPWTSYRSRSSRLVTKELTDEHGEYFFNPNLKQGNLIWATAAGFDEKFLDLNLDVMGTSVRKDFNLTLHVNWLSNYAVYGTLRDKKNRIIKGSVVRIYIKGSVVGEKGKEIVVKPNAEGWYSRPLFIGDYEITAMAPGYKDQKRKVTMYASGKKHDFNLVTKKNHFKCFS